MHHSLRWAHDWPALFTFHTLHSLISVNIPYMHHFILSVFVFLLSLSIDLGRLVNTGPAQVSKKIPSRLVRDGHRKSWFIASLLYVSHCILISIARFGRLSIEPIVAT